MGVRLEELCDGVVEEGGKGVLFLCFLFLSKEEKREEKEKSGVKKMKKEKTTSSSSFSLPLPRGSSRRKQTPRSPGSASTFCWSVMSVGKDKRKKKSVSEFFC